jgi:transposase-like protein
MSWAEMSFEEKHDAVAQAYENADVSIADVAEQLGVSHSHLYDFASRHRMSKRKRQDHVELTERSVMSS